MTSLDPRALRNAFGTFMTGVTVVTSNDANGHPLGFTANSFTSVSLDPPLVLVCLANSSTNYESLIAADGFAVSILSETQTEVSNTFARPVDDRFAHVEWRLGPVGSPLIEGASAWFDCAMHKIVDAGDHVILIGEVKAFDNTPAPGLGYVRGAYVTPSTTAGALTQDTGIIVSALIERAGQVLLVDAGDGALAPPEAVVGSEGVSAALDKLIEATGLTAKPGFVYSVYEDADRKRQHIAFLCQAADEGPQKGTFVPLDDASFGTVTDAATRTMLERLSEESRLGDFGIYYGDQISGEVRPITREGL
ncbi:NADH-FMN oxidoreductase RutF, flavin reductase (DIM6/NTAB) family [Ruegeria halocynthiae]|uniref:NADH-FMN oxidoreductase RutF, flavin reductase (DIM6/NTAB) family n=1 Tax=Ruegeria halocynthiae TaxID=985054 RepID=A0A1H3E6R8_9RHOB|nr:flavin reductase [Ruegeria halocynthiae]SDX74462.1 NADH-FMN oxidoreductase RutF, flavin reductase (DIM6/NTAB) family [Ruegeria halocynthiae]